MTYPKSTIEKVNSIIEYNYLTIKITHGRISKGLLALPASLAAMFPDKKQKIRMYFDDDENCSELNFTPCSSTSREGRIGGMRKWFDAQQIRNNDELVIQVIDKDDYIFRIMPEKQYLHTMQSLQGSLDLAQDDLHLDSIIERLSAISNSSQDNVLQSEFIRLANMDESPRNRLMAAKAARKESVPHASRRILGEIYQGRCQLSGFTFIQKNGRPYFEIHHIDENKGNYLKNLLLVSPNIHAQFTHSNKSEYFDDEGWLRKVRFNNDEMDVFQFIDKVKRQNFTKTIYY